MEVIVPDDQLSLAIGKKGQNVRLASRLTGWRLDVRSESEAEDEARRARASLTAIPGVGDVTAELLYQNGFKSAEELAASDDETVGEVDGIGPERADGHPRRRRASTSSSSERGRGRSRRGRSRARPRPPRRPSRRDAGGAAPCRTEPAVDEEGAG